MSKIVSHTPNCQDKEANGNLASSADLGMMAVKVGELFSITDEDLHRIY